MDRPKPGLVKRRTRLTSTQDKNISDDEFMAAAIGDTEWLRQSLRSKGGAINYDKNGLAPIHLAAIHGRLDSLKLLVDKLKIDVNLPSTTGWRPVHLAISNQTGKRSFQCLLYLLDKGADPSITNDDGITPMHQAASEGHVQCLKALIEVGANIDGEDRRGHKPIDLAKLWGHRKCARILGAETWHRDKDFLSKELHQLQKVKMQKILQDIEQDEVNKFDQQFYGELAYKNWLQEKGLQEPDLEARDADQKDILRKETKESLHKANSIWRTTEENNLPTSKGKTSRADYSKRVTESPASGDGKHKLSDIDETSHNELCLHKPNSGSVHHENPWNVSTHLPQPDYPPKLADYYPRDEFTMKPKYPLKKGGRLAPTINMVPIKHENISSAAKLRKPRLPPEMLEQALMEGPPLDRPVIYKCKNIMDVQTLKRFDKEILPKSETALHLCDDKNSALFRAALQYPKGSSNTSIASGSGSSATSKLSAKFSEASVNNDIKI